MKEGGRHDFNAVWEFCYHALQFFFPPTNTETMTNYYTRQTRINDVMNDPAFGDYGRLIFPMNTGYWSGTTLEQLDLTWYNYIDPDKTVEVCNCLRNHAAECFIDIYTEEEKQTNPDLRNTGLFFFRATAMPLRHLQRRWWLLLCGSHARLIPPCPRTLEVGLQCLCAHLSSRRCLRGLGPCHRLHLRPRRRVGCQPHRLLALGWLRFWQQQSGATAIRSTTAIAKQSDTIYSLNGTRRNTMQKGVNIINGRKIITK